MSPVSATLTGGSNLDPRLDLSHATYRVENFTVNGKELAVYIYENLLYVTNPTEPNFQVLNIFVPEVYYSNMSISSSQGSSRVTYNKDTAPILFYNKVGGYMSACPVGLTSQLGSSAGELSGKEREYILVALEYGYVVASSSARGRMLQSNGVYTGKVPAVIVDLKAVRYLRANDAHLLGSAERLVSIWTSAGVLFLICSERPLTHLFMRATCSKWA